MTVEPTSSLPLRILGAGATDRGRVREYNQDAFLVRPGKGVFVVADGVGGGYGGDVVSRRIVADLGRLADTGQPTLAEISTALENINSEIFDKASKRGEDMASTVDVLLLDVAAAAGSICHVGDSRVYQWRDGRLKQLTTDDSMAEKVRRTSSRRQLRRLGNLDHLDGQITKGVGVESTLVIDPTTFELALDDLYLLCSDGLNKHVSDAEIGLALAKVRRRGVEATVDALVALTNERGGSDNVTVVIAWIVAATPATSDSPGVSPPPTAPAGVSSRSTSAEGAGATLPTADRSQRVSEPAGCRVPGWLPPWRRRVLLAWRQAQIRLCIVAERLANHFHRLDDFRFRSVRVAGIHWRRGLNHCHRHPRLAISLTVGFVLLTLFSGWFGWQSTTQRRLAAERTEGWRVELAAEIPFDDGGLSWLLEADRRLALEPQSVQELFRPILVARAGKFAAQYHELAAQALATRHFHALETALPTLATDKGDGAVEPPEALAQLIEFSRRKNELRSIWLRIDNFIEQGNLDSARSLVREFLAIVAPFHPDLPEAPPTASSTADTDAAAELRACLTAWPFTGSGLAAKLPKPGVESTPAADDSVAGATIESGGANAAASDAAPADPEQGTTSPTLPVVAATETGDEEPEIPAGQVAIGEEPLPLAIFEPAATGKPGADLPVASATGDPSDAALPDPQAPTPAALPTPTATGEVPTQPAAVEVADRDEEKLEPRPEIALDVPATVPASPVEPLDPPSIVEASTTSDPAGVEAGKQVTAVDPGADTLTAPIAVEPAVPTADTVAALATAAELILETAGNGALLGEASRLKLQQAMDDSKVSAADVAVVQQLVATVAMALSETFGNLAKAAELLTEGQLKTLAAAAPDRLQEAADEAMRRHRHLMARLEQSRFSMALAELEWQQAREPLQAGATELAHGQAALDNYFAQLAVLLKHYENVLLQRNLRPAEIAGEFQMRWELYRTKIYAPATRDELQRKFRLAFPDHQPPR